MKITSILKLGLAWITLPVGCLLGALYAGVVGQDGSGIPLSEQVFTYLTIAIVYPVMCLGACILGSRLRQSRLLSGGARVRRSKIAVFAQLVLPLAVVTSAAYLIPVTVMAGLATGSYWPHPIVAGVALAHAVAYVSLAVALGLRVRPLIAAPLSVLVPFVFLGFPQGYEPRWLRHLTQLPASCCQVYTQPDPHVLTAIVLVATGITLGAVALFLPTPGPSAPRLLLTVAAVTSAAVAVTTVRDQPYQALSARAGHPRCETVGQSELCVWPEHEQFRAEAAQTIQRVTDIGRRTGAQVPSRFTETMPDDVTWPEASIDLTPTGDRISWIVDGLDPATTCRQRRPKNGSDHSETGNPASDALRFWWARELGSERLPRIDFQAKTLVAAVDRHAGLGVDDLVRRSAAVSCGPAAT